MKPAPFKYVAPETLDDALALLGEDARPLAGGQSLMPLLNLRMARPEVLVDLRRLRGLDTAARDGEVIRIGALTRHHQFEERAFLPELPLLREAIGHVAHPAVRTRGTIGGSLAHADPAAELPLCVLTLEGDIVLRRTGGERTLPAADFFEDVFTTACADDELLTEIRIPVPGARTGTAFEEIARRHGDFAIVAAAATVQLDGDRRIGTVRLALGGVGPCPVRAGEVEDALHGLRPGEHDFFRTLTAALAAQTARLRPVGDLHATADYRRKVAAVLARRALMRAAESAAT